MARKRSGSVITLSKTNEVEDGDRDITDANADSDSDDAPEVMSQSVAKKRARKDEEVVRGVEEAVKRREKERRREADRRLKERAGRNRGGRDGEEEEGGVKRRKVESVEESDDDDENDDEEDGSDDDDDEEDEDASDHNDDNDEEDGSDDDDDDNSEPAPKLKSILRRPTSTYLPDHIFRSALSKSSNPNSLPPTSDTTSQPAELTKLLKRRKKKLARRRAGMRDGGKDIVLGSRTYRSSTSTQPTKIQPPEFATAAQRTAPSSRITRFLNRRLGLSLPRANSASGAGTGTGLWERRPANLGTLAPSAPIPASHFVRVRR